MQMSVGLSECVLWVNALLIVPLLCTGLTIHVDRDGGNESVNCWTKEHNYTCKYLDDALVGAQQMLGNADYIEILLSAGEHILGPNTSLSYFTDASNFTIAGTGTTAESVVVNCDHRNGFAFSDSRGLTFEYLVLKHCLSQSGMPEELVTMNVNTHVALALYNCHHLTMRNVTVRDNNGIGVLLYNTLGTNQLQNCTFANNQDHNDSDNNQGRAFGGVVVVFFYCFYGYPNKACLHYINSSEEFQTRYEVEDCLFMDNNSTNGEFIEPRLSVSLGHYREHVSKGGGLALLMHGQSSNTTIHIQRCRFLRNSASWGGGAHVCYRDFSRNNTIHFKDCLFDSNLSPTRSKPGGSHGGGTDVVYLQQDEDDAYNNRALYENCIFRNNSALFGGGISMQVSEVQALHNNVILRHCLFEGNTANIGAAADLSVSFQTASFGETTGRTLAHFTQCTFSRNMVVPGRVALDQTPRIGNGALYIFRIQTMFEGINKFEGNHGTGLVLATWATLTANSQLLFINNTGSFGGGIHFSGLPRLDISDNTSLEFIGNTAKYMGGAFYASYSDVHSEVYQSSCFIGHAHELKNPDDWNTTFVFKNNRCKNKVNSVWVSSLIPCYWLDSKHPNNPINTTFCWRNWHYVDSTCHAEISSLGTQLVSEVTRDTEFFPGISQKVPVKLIDDLGHDVSAESILTATVTKGEGVMQSNDFFRADSNVTILGVPNTDIEVTLQTQGASGFMRTCNIHLLYCPPGFVPKLSYIEYSSYAHNTSWKCVCGGSYGGTVQCDSDSTSATIMDGFSMSYDDTLEQTVVGPIPYPIYSSAAGQRPLPHRVSELDEAMCGELNRTGLLCSQCQSGLSVKMGFTTLDCIDCTAGLAGSWFIFFAEQLLPITLFFLFIILGNINAASAPFNAFIFFSQVMTTPLTFRLISPWVHSIGSRSFINTFTEAESVIFIPYSIWNLDFKLIHIFHRHVCFVSGNNILAHISLEYLNAIYPLLLIGIAYLLVSLHGINFRPVVLLWRPFRACLLKFRRTWNPKLTIINAFATFVIVSYVEFLTTSVKLLASLQLYGSDSELNYRYFFDASKHYLGPHHLPYAVLAMTVMSVVILPTPVLMFLYPLRPVQQAIGAMRCKYCNWHGLRIFVEAMQGCFKDGTNGTKDRRFFAGLYFVFRIALISVLGVATTFTLQYLLTILFILVMILLFLLLEPYKDPFYNKFDVVIFVIMLSVHITNFFNVYTNILVGEPSVPLWAISQVLLALPLLYVVVVKGLQFVWRKTKLSDHWLEWKQRRRIERMLEEEEEESSVEPMSFASFKREMRKRKRSSLTATGRPRLVTISEVTLSDEMPDRMVNPDDYIYESLEEHVDSSRSPPLVERQLTDSQNALYGSLEDDNASLITQEMQDLSCSKN